MSIMSLLIISTFSIICTLTYENIKRDNFERLQKIISLPMIETHLIRDSKVIIENRSINYIPYFKIYFTNQGSIIDTNSSVYVDDDIYKSALDLALKSNKKNSVINIDGNKWMFMVNSLPSEKAALTHETKISKRGTTSPFNLDIDTQSTYEVIFLDVTSTSKTFSNLVITFILVGIATLIIIYAISIYFANRAIKPIEEAFTKQKQFIADASHELKTPLAIINANHDVLFSNKEHTIQSQIKWLNYIEIQIGRMSKLINNLLYLAKIDYVDNSEFIKLPFNISELIEEVVLCINAISF